MLVRIGQGSDGDDNALASSCSHLLGAAAMDACGQPAILSYDHNGQAYAFAGLERCRFGSRWCGKAVWAMVSESGSVLYDAECRCVAELHGGQSTLGLALVHLWASGERQASHSF